MDFPAQYNDAYKLDYPQRFGVLDSILGNQMLQKNSIQKIPDIEVFYQTAKKQNDKIAILYAELLLFSYKKDFTYYPEKEAVKICNGILRKARDFNHPALQALSYIHLGHYYYWNMNNSGVGLYYYLKAYDIYKNLSTQEFRSKSTSLEFLCYTFYRFADYQKAIQFGKQALEIYTASHSEEFSLLFLNNTVGMAYYKTMQYDSAIFFHNKAQGPAAYHYKRNRFRGWQGINEGNIACCFQKLNKYDSAVYYFKRAIDTTIKYNVIDNACGFAIELCNIYLSQNNQDINKYLPIAKSTTIQAGGNNDKYNLYVLLKNYSSRKNDFKAASGFADSMVLYKNILVENDSKKAGLEIQLKYETEFKKEEEKKLDEEIANARLLRKIFIGVVILLALIAILILNRQKLKNNIERQKALIKEKEMQNELELATVKLQEITLVITEKNGLIELLEQKNEAGVNNQYIHQLQNNIILTDEQWDNFKHLFEKVHPGFMNKLKTNINNITPAEIRLLVLAKIKLNTKEMASSLGVTTQAVRKSWYRLREKLNLPTETILEEFVETI